MSLSSLPITRATECRAKDQVYEHFLLVDNLLNRYLISPDQSGLTYSADGAFPLYVPTWD